MISAADHPTVPNRHFRHFPAGLRPRCSRSAAISVFAYILLTGDRGFESVSLQQRVSCEPEDDVEAERRALAPIDFAPDCPGVHAIAGIAEQVLRLEGTWPWRARRIWPVAMSGRRTLREQDRPRLQPFASSFGAVCENGFHHEPLW
jgi:hypothetical protein